MVVEYTHPIVSQFIMVEGRAASVKLYTNAPKVAI